MIFISEVETVRLALAVNISLLPCILFLCFSKGKSRLLLCGYLPKVSVIYNLCDIVIQKFYDPREILRVPFHDHDVLFFSSIFICLYLKLSDTLRNMYVGYFTLDLFFASIFWSLFTVSLVILHFYCSEITDNTG